MTPLSHLGFPVDPTTRPNAWLARLSLGAGFMALLAGGCVVSDPPEYGRADQTPPLLNLVDAAPSITQILVVEPGDRVDFNVPVRSEDPPGDELFAQLFLDYTLSTEEFQRFARVQPSTFSDTDRAIVMQWNVPNGAAGCRQLTLVVTHASNLNAANRPDSSEDTAIATWWVNIDDDSDTPNTLASCPTISAGGAP